MSHGIEEAWQCDDCLEIYVYEDEVRECRPSDHYEVYVCPKCELWYEDFSSAELCCTFKDNDCRD